MPRGIDKDRRSTCYIYVCVHIAHTCMYAERNCCSVTDIQTSVAGFLGFHGTPLSAQLSSRNVCTVRNSMEPPCLMNSKIIHTYKRFLRILVDYLPLSATGYSEHAIVDREWAWSMQKWAWPQNFRTHINPWHLMNQVHEFCMLVLRSWSLVNTTFILITICTQSC